MIYQKKSPKTRLEVLCTNENFDFICKAAGEHSLSAYVNRVLDEVRESYGTNCNSQTPKRIIGVEYHAR